MHPQSSHRTQPTPCQTESGTDIASSVTITLESISGSRRTTISFMGNTVIHAMTGSRSTKNTGASSGFCKWSTISSAIHSQHSFSTTTSVPPSLPLRSVNSARRMRAIPSWHTLGSRKKTLACRTKLVLQSTLYNYSLYRPSALSERVFPAQTCSSVI